MRADSSAVFRLTRSYIFHLFYQNMSVLLVASLQIPVRVLERIHSLRYQDSRDFSAMRLFNTPARLGGTSIEVKPYIFWHQNHGNMWLQGIV